MNILVTGAAGFIGSHLCEALLGNDHTVFGVDNFDSFYSSGIKENNIKEACKHSHFHFIRGDAGDQDLLNRIKDTIDVVVHLAAKAGVQPSLKDPQAYIHTNIVVTNSLLEWMRSRNIKKLVFASSSSVYGNNSKIPFEETDKVNEPISPYAFSKLSCELLNHTYHKLYDFGIVNLRFFTVYGERQRPDLAIYKFVKNLFEHKPIAIYGDGRSARDYTYVGDSVKGIIAAINYVYQYEGLWEIFNIGNHSPVYLIDLVNAVAKAVDLEPILTFEEMKPGDVNITYASIDKANKILGYRPSTKLETGLRNFVDWYRRQSML